MHEQKDNIRNKLAAYKILAVEASITIVLAFLLLMSVDAVIAYSVALGGLAFVIPNTFFARYVFRYSAAESLSLAIRWFYIGEAVKIIMTVLIFAACFIWVKPLNVIALFATFLIMMFVNAIGLALLKTEQIK
ncbi:MAG: ATP synthase subunit I [Gammaproteobacteria bacterium]|nr:ATP synthase subunit I [Gammaproteobacteria bacterium]